MATVGGNQGGEIQQSASDRPTLTGGTPPPLIERGTLLAAGRYQILDILGQGAMGAVYKAKDCELDRCVALKVIQSELANSPAMLKRFKQELILARQVTHKNVVRIFDIGETDGMKFITMEYVDGADLKSLIIERGKIPPLEAADIVQQICQALDAAHAEGVVHRDLKPQNIMIDRNGRVVVMDFGIAHSNELPGMTMTGALMGTPQYMSPEQAKGERTDMRADIFALGIIFYEMLTGKVPFVAQTLVETMYKRTQERAVPPVDLDHSVPLQANRIVMKCLETDPANRYQNVKQLLEDLQTFDPEEKIGTWGRLLKAARRKSKSFAAIAAAAAVIALAVLAGSRLRDQTGSGPVVAQHAPVTVLVADFTNHTGDPVFDGALEPVVKMALNGAGFITAYDRTQMRDLGLPPFPGRFDESSARKIAVGQGLGVVLAGSLDRQDDAYALSIRATHAVTGNTISIAEDKVSGKDQVLFATAKLAATVRKALGDDTSDAALRFAMETLTATSLEAVHDYATGVDQLTSGSYEEALRSFSRAVDLDPNFGLAYAAMAIAARNLGRQQDAEKYIKLALVHIDRMTEREKYRVRGSYYALNGDLQKCIDEYGSLISRFPSDAAARNNIAFCWTQLRNMQRAVDEISHAVTVLPKRTMYRNNLSLYASYAGDFEKAEREARVVQEHAPAFYLGFVSLAFAQLGQGRLAEAAETYRMLESISPQGASEAASGLADIALYEGRFREAAEILERAAAVDLAGRSADAAATKFVMLAQTRLLQGRKQLAIEAAERALESSRIVKIRFLAGRVFAAAGETERARVLASELSKELRTEPQAYGKLIEGEIALAGGDPRKAIEEFSNANGLVDTWIGRFDLGRAYLAANAFIEADSEFDRCLKRRGEALSLFLDESPTFSFLPPVYYHLGRVRQGLKSAGYAESYETYLEIRGKAAEDPVLADVRKRLDP